MAQKQAPNKRAKDALLMPRLTASNLAALASPPPDSELVQANGTIQLPSPTPRSRAKSEAASRATKAKGNVAATKCSFCEKPLAAAAKGQSGLSCEQDFAVWEQGFSYMSETEAAEKYKSDAQFKKCFTNSMAHVVTDTDAKPWKASSVQSDICIGGKAERTFGQWTRAYVISMFHVCSSVREIC